MRQGVSVTEKYINQQIYDNHNFSKTVNLMTRCKKVVEKLKKKSDLNRCRQSVYTTLPAFFNTAPFDSSLTF